MFNFIPTIEKDQETGENRVYQMFIVEFYIFIKCFIFNVVCKMHYVVHDQQQLLQQQQQGVKIRMNACSITIVDCSVKKGFSQPVSLQLSISLSEVKQSPVIVREITLPLTVHSSHPSSIWQQQISHLLSSFALHHCSFHAVLNLSSLPSSLLLSLFICNDSAHFLCPEFLSTDRVDALFC